MELTKFEEKLLDPVHLKRYRFLFWMGVALLLACLVVLYFQDVMVDKVQAPYRDIALTAQNIDIQTQNEQVLKDLLLHTVEAAEAGWGSYVGARIMNLCTILMLVGVFMISSFLLRRKTHDFAVKLKRNSM